MKSLEDKIIREVMQKASIKEDEAFKVEKHQVLTETLHELSGLSEEEIQQISDRVKQEHRQQKVTQYLWAALVSAAAVPVALYFFLTPPSLDEVKYLSEELVLNSGNEEKIKWGGEIPGWVQVQGDWEQREEDPAAHEGKYYFYAGSGKYGELHQDIDLTEYASAGGMLGFDFSCFARSYYEGDFTEVKIEAYAGDDRVEVFGTGKKEYKDSWTKLGLKEWLPEGVTKIRIRLISHRDSGLHNDGYFDAVSLKIFSEKD